MALDATQYKLDLEDYIASHMEGEMKLAGKNVEIGIRKKLVTPFKKPIITLAEVSDVERPSGGMNYTGLDGSDLQQGWYHDMEYFITVNTDDRTGGARELTKLSSLLVTTVFEKKRHLLLAEVDGTDFSLEGRGVVSGGDWYQSQFMMRISVIVSFDSIVLT